MDIAVLILAIALACTTAIRLMAYRFPGSHVTSDELPTVSLLIPARNETHAITRALNNALALDYVKLEIIVLDDESQDNTPEKIRSFAHEGVRFIQGDPLPKEWIGKNWACHQLSQAASGDYLVFCDMDVQLSSKGLTRLIRHMRDEKIAASSVLPRLVAHRLGSICAPLLPWMLTVMPRGFGAYPAYGGLFVVQASVYHQHGGFCRYPDNILPELQLARDFTSRKYRLFTHSRNLNILLHKKPSSLSESRSRYLFGLYRSHPGVAGIHFVLTLFPPVVLAVNIWTFLVVVAAFGVFARLHIQQWVLATVFLPVVCIIEIGTLLHSAWVHTHGQASWKSRHIS